MCLIVFAYRVHPQYDVVMLANRDEFHARRGDALHQWPNGMYAGRDPQAGGTWLGLHPQGRIGALTNVRDGPLKVSPRSRGELLTGYLADPRWCPPEGAAAGDYNGFNLLTVDYNGGEWQMALRSNRFPHRTLSPGVYALSNGTLDSRWPKTEKARHDFSALLNGGSLPTLEWLSALSDRCEANDADLPDTGIGRDKERWLSPCFIVSPHYGTVSANVLYVQRQNAYIGERRYDAQGNTVGEREFHVSLQLQR